MTSIEIPPLLLQFIVTIVAAFVLGLELHQVRRTHLKPTQTASLGFGTTRTLTLTAIIGFVLYHIGALTAFLAGLGMLTIWLSVEYWYRLQTGHDKRLLTRLLIVAAYCLGPMVMLTPPWFVALFVVVTLLLLGERPKIRQFSDAFRYDEGVRLAKFLLMAGLVLPLLPKTPIQDWIPVTWYEMWLAMIVVSGISYASYLVQTYFLPNRGLLLTGLLGGLYSSTAATVVLARRAANHAAANTSVYSVPIILATAMMYLRLWVIVYALGHHQAAIELAAPFAALVVISLVISLLLHRRSATTDTQEPDAIRHPLEFSTAILFAFLFVFFAALTQWVTQTFGTEGLNLLSLVVGFSDIDPFILSILAGKFSVSDSAIVGAILIASGSNNLLKAIYALTLSRSRSVLPAAIWLIASFLLSLGYVFLT